MTTHIIDAELASNARRIAMLEKVRKLFAQADSVAGTPEADIFNAKAYELIAQYGIDEVEARRAENTGPAPIVTVRFDLTGRYIPEQRYLLHSLANALHCSPLQIINMRGVENHEAVSGTELHIDRLRILFAALSTQMLAGGATVRPEPTFGVSTAVYRRSWMRGFRWEVAERLGQAENKAAQLAEPGTDLVLLDDATRAQAGMKQHVADLGGRIKTQRSKGQHHEAAAELGREAGRRADLGRSGLRQQRALAR